RWSRWFSLSSTVDLGSWVQTLQMAAFGSRGGIDDAVDDRRLTRRNCFGESLGEALRIGHMIARAAESLDEFVIARSPHENSWRWIGAPATVEVVAPVDAAVVEDDSDDRERIAANGLDLHAAEPEGAIAFDGDHGLSARHCCADGITHTDTHHTPGAGVETFA